MAQNNSSYPSQQRCPAELRGRAVRMVFETAASEMSATAR
jgi:hypothetical protein